MSAAEVEAAVVEAVVAFAVVFGAKDSAFEKTSAHVEAASFEVSGICRIV